LAGITEKTRPYLPDEEETVDETMRLFNELTTYRNVHAAQWEEAAQLIDPDSRNTFYYGSYNFPGIKKTQQQVDSTGALALQGFCAIVDSLVTPKTQKWHGLEGDEYVMKDPASRRWFDDVRDILFRFRYRPEANFASQNFANWKSLGGFGNSVMYIDELDTRVHQHAVGLRYRGVPLGECFFAENHQHQVDTMVRWFRRTARQAVQMFGEEWLPPTLRPALERDLQTPYQFLHCVKPRGEDYDDQRLDEKGMPFESYYISIEGKCMMGPERGYRVFPYAVSRYIQTPGEVYGRGPAQLVLPALKTLNVEKRIFLKTGHRAADPVLLTRDDGLVDGFNLEPGRMNKGGVSEDGKPLVIPLPTGSVQITEEMMKEERGIVDTMFLTSLFKVLTEHPDMTATQVIELLNERGMLVAPTLGRQHTEYVGGLVPRELDLLSRMRGPRGRPVLPPMPPRLREAMGYYEVVDTSPLAMAARGNEVAGLYRFAEFGKGIATDTGDMTFLDAIDAETAGPEAARLMGLPERWVSSSDKIAAKQKNRQLAQQRQEQIQAMPAQAAMMKAQAAQQKAGIPAPGQPGAQPGPMQ
jgi:hypothetical protein